MAYKTHKRLMRWHWSIGGSLAALALIQACGAADSETGDPFASKTSNSGSDGESRDLVPGTTVGNGSGVPQLSIDGASKLPSEVEVSVDFEAPQASVNYVYATSPDSDSVAVIDAKSLAIELVQTGDEPRFLKTIPGKDAALLVDVAARDIAYLETKSGKSQIRYYSKLPPANAIAVAPDGKHALAYFDASRRAEGNLETLQDVTVLSLAGESPVATRMTIGFQARQVTFAGGASNSDAAYVVTDDGVSVLNFAEIDSKGSSIANTVPIFSAVEQKGADVSVTPDGKYALGRLENSPILRLVDLASGAAKSLDIASVLATAAGEVSGDPGAGGAGSGTSTSTATSVIAQTAAVSDLDLSRDGSYALAVSRDRSTLFRIPIPGGFAEPSQIKIIPIQGVLVGSAAMSSNGRWAVLYTTIASEERVVIVDLSEKVEPRPVDLAKAVSGVTFSTSGDQAFVVHQKADGDPKASGISADLAIDRSYGYSLLDLTTGFRKLMLTEDTPLHSVTVPNEPYVFLSFGGKCTKVQRVDTDSLVDETIDLGTRPVSIGVVPDAGRVFVNQEHDAGRLTFIDWETMATRSVTGYELNSKVRE